MSNSLFCAALAAAISVAAHGDEPQHLNEVLVTATKTPVALADSLAPATVLTAADIERLHLSDFSQVLERMPSVNIVATGGRGSNFGLSLRGTNTNHTLVLVDGVRVNSASTGTTALEYLDPMLIERVELVRGPRSSLYGADALGGVLHILTRKQPEKSYTTLKVAAGSHGRRETAFSGGLSSEDSLVNVQLSNSEDQGIDRTAWKNQGNGDRDSYRAARLALSAEHNLSDRVKAGLSFQKHQGESEYDNAFCAVANCKPYYEFAIQSALVNLEATPQSGWRLSASAAQSRDDSRARDDLDTLQDDRFKTRRDSLNLQSDWDLFHQDVISLGYEYTDETLASSNAYQFTQRDNHAVFAQYQLNGDAFNAVVGARQDDNEAFGRRHTANLALSYQLSDSSKMIASWGTAFRAPTFNDLYWPVSPFGQGNPDLTPETSENLELGLKYNRGNFVAEVALYQNRIEDLIAWAPIDPTYTTTWAWTPSNVADAQITGVEVSLAKEMLGWQVSANASWLDPRDRESDKVLVSRSRQLGNLEISRNFGGLHLATSVHAQGQRFDDADNQVRVPGYGLVDLSVAYDISRDLKVQLKVANLLDKSYTSRATYLEDGRNFLLSVNYTL